VRRRRHVAAALALHRARAEGGEVEEEEGSALTLRFWPCNVE
jgi:hypothetical protein